MSGKAGFTPEDPEDSDNRHGNPLFEGIFTALNWMTVLPVPGASVFDRTTGARVMASLPFVGFVFGMFTAIIMWAIGPISGVIHVDGLLVAVLIVAFWELLNRFMHLDGLADVSDALGSYAAPPRAREILADPRTGLFGLATAMLSVLVQVAAVASLVDSTVWWMICFIPVLGRIAGQVTALKNHHAFSPTGFGALVIGTVKFWWIALWLLVTPALAFWCAELISPLSPLTSVNTPFVAGPFPAAINPAWLGGWVAITAVVACVFAALFSRRLSRSFGGLNGDCIGACIHLGASISAVMLAVVANALV